MIQAIKTPRREDPQPSQIHTPQTQNRSKVTDSAQGTLSQLGKSLNTLPANSYAETNPLANSWCLVDKEEVEEEERLQNYLKQENAKPVGTLQRWLFGESQPKNKPTDVEAALEKAKKDPMSMFFEEEVSLDNAAEILKASTEKAKKSVDQRPNALTIDQLSRSTLAAGVTWNGEELQSV
jgi:hypothetical protein